MPAGAGAFIGRSGRMPCCSATTPAKSYRRLPRGLVFPLTKASGARRCGWWTSEASATAQWAEAARRRDLLAALAGRPARSRADVDAVAKELGIKRRRVWTLLRQTAAGDCDIAAFLPRRARQGRSG